MKEVTLTATATTDLAALKDLVVEAAIYWVVDQDCASALAALEEAVADYREARRAARAKTGKPDHRA